MCVHVENVEKPRRENVKSEPERTNRVGWMCSVSATLYGGMRPGLDGEDAPNCIDADDCYLEMIDFAIVMEMMEQRRV